MLTQNSHWHTVVAAVLTVVGIQALNASPTQTVDPTVRAILDQAPAKAQILFVVPSLAKLGEKMATLNEQLGLHLDDLDVLVSEFKRTTGLIVGLNQDGPLMVTMTIRPAAPGGNEQVEAAVAEFLTFLPTTDFKALAENFGASVPEDVETTATGITLRTRHAAFVRKSGSFTIWGARRELVENHRPDLGAQRMIRRLGQVGSRCLDDGDLVLILRSEDKRRLIDSLLDLIGPPLRSKVQKIAAQKAESLTAGDHSGGRSVTGGNSEGPRRSDAYGMITSNLGTQVFNRTSDTLNHGGGLLRDADAIAIGFNIDENGIGLTGSVQFKAGSEMAGVMADGGGAAKLLARMPDRQFVFASSVNFDGLRLDKLDRDSARLLGMDLPSNWLGSTLFQVAATEGRVSGMTNVYYLPQAAGLSVGMAGFRIVRTTDTGGFVAALRQNLEALNGTDGAGQAADTGAEDQRSKSKVTVKYQSKDLVMGGHRVDKYVISQGMGPALNTSDSIAPMFGPSDLNNEKTGYVVEAGQYVVITGTTNTELLGRVLDALKSDQGLGTDGPITESRSLLFEDPVIEVYVDVGSILNSPMGSMAMMMLGQQLKPPQNLLPVAMAATIEQNGIQTRFFIPMSLLRFVKEIADRVGSQWEQMPRQTGRHRPTNPRGPKQRRPAGYPPQPRIPPSHWPPMPSPGMPY